MATVDLSQYDPASVPNAKGMKIGVVISEWNHEITNGLRKGAIDTLIELGAEPNDIVELWVPGSFELAGGAQLLFEKNDVNGVVCLGSVIQGETRHFDFVCEATANGIMNVGVKYNRPAIFGVLTDNNMEQAKARSGGKLGNKGVECAVACVKMIDLWR